MIQAHQGYAIDDERGRIDYRAVHGWLANSYWSPGISRERIESGAAASTLVIGIYSSDGQQVGFGRVVSDTTRFAYLCDVWIAQEHRGSGLARALVNFALQHPLLKDVDLWTLRTVDAHGVYESLGFTLTPTPERWMERPRPLVGS